MKIMTTLGSPRRQGNTAKVLGSAMLLPNRRRIASPNSRRPRLSGSMAQRVPR